MYYVDLDTGTELTRMLQYAATTSQPILAANNLSYQPAIHLVMHPDVGGFPADWIYILIIVIALLIVSFLASGKVCFYVLNLVFSFFFFFISFSCLYSKKWVCTGIYGVYEEANVLCLKTVYWIWEMV